MLRPIAFSPIQLGGVNAVAVVDEELLRFLSRDYLPERSRLWSAVGWAVTLK